MRRIDCAANGLACHAGECAVTLAEPASDESETAPEADIAEPPGTDLGAEPAEPSDLIDPRSSAADDGCSGRGAGAGAASVVALLLLLSARARLPGRPGRRGA